MFGEIKKTARDRHEGNGGFFNRTVVKVFLYPNIIKISETAHSSPIFFSAKIHNTESEQTYNNPTVHCSPPFNLASKPSTSLPQRQIFTYLPSKYPMKKTPASE